MDLNLNNYRKQYNYSELDESMVPTEPMKLFKMWFDEAESNELFEANAMVLSTVSNNRPSSRVVLLKEIKEGNFIFFTNYKSRKAYELEKNNNVSLLFFWQQLQRQIRIEGTVSRIDASESDRYFNERPYESKISAIVSPQSRVIDSRKVLEIEIKNYEQQNLPVSRPDFWGGYAVMPLIIEFWQGRVNRLHDRIRYTKQQEGWSIDRLAP